MNITFDNIIFALQKYGGISVVWHELLKRVLLDSDFNASFIDFPNQNMLRHQLDIPMNNILKNNLLKFPLNIQRYINPKIPSEKGIFHSSYFRIVNDRNIINITTVHDFIYEYFFNGLAKRIHHHQKSNAIKHSKNVICVSENTKDDLLKFYPQIKEEQVKVVYNGVSEDYYPLLEKEINSMNKFIPFYSKEYILYVGNRRSAYKNFRMLVEACQIVKIPLVIVGGGELSKYEESILEVKLGANQYIQLDGITNAQLNQLYNHAAFLVYPSLYEGFGIPIIEAQKAGCPVICSNKSSISEIAGKGAFVINKISALKIAEILNQNKSRSGMTTSIINQGFINAQLFSWDKCYQQTKQVYLEAYFT
jgi:mannosyltransferase